MPLVVSSSRGNLVAFVLKAMLGCEVEVQSEVESRRPLTWREPLNLFAGDVRNRPSENT